MFGIDGLGGSGFSRFRVKGHSVTYFRGYRQGLGTISNLACLF